LEGDTECKVSVSERCLLRLSMRLELTTK